MANETGRSLVEMLGTLAIMGILSMTGIAAFRSAMDAHHANEVINEAQKRATMIAPQIMMMDNIALTLSEFTGNDLGFVNFDTTVYTKSNLASMPKGQFGIKIENVEKSICQKILNAMGENTSLRNITYPAHPTIQAECDETGSYLLIFNEDLGLTDTPTSPQDSEPAQECEADSDCKTVCGTCQKESNEETGACINECEIPTNACTYDTDCNTNNECMVCDTTTHSCKDGCTRVEYLESTGTQYIDTGIIPNSNTQVDVKFCFTNVIFRAADAYLNGIAGDKMVWGYGGATSRDYIHIGISNKNTYSEGCPVVLDKDYHLIFDGSGYFSCNGRADTISVRSFAQTGSMSLFARKNGASNDAAFFGKVYYLKLRDNGNLVRDFIPVLDWNYTPCMYDKVSRQLFYNQGTEDFKTNLD